MLRIMTALTLTCLVPVANGARAQSLAAQWNPRTGTLRLLPQVATGAPTPAVYTGVFAVTLVVNVVSTVPAAQPINCTITVSATDVTTFGSYFNDVTLPATRSGSVATCTTTIPYSWTLTSRSTYTASYQVNTANATGNSLRGAGAFPNRASVIPANGATTKLSITTRL